MATDRGKQVARVVRYRPSGVTPLEIWDFKIGGGILSDHVGSRCFRDVLHETLHMLHAGQGRTRSGSAVPACCRGFDTVVLTGGRAGEDLINGSTSAGPFSMVCLGPDPFIGESGGYHVLGDAAPSGAVVDVGQNQIKISLANRRFTYPRDYDILPVCSDDASETVGDIAVESQRDVLQRFLGDSLRHACQSTGLTPSALVVALPCELDDRSVPGGSSYLGTKGNLNLVPKSLRLAGLDECESALLNDAELAALSVASSPTRLIGDRLLVLTIGFGVGAAILDTRI